MTHKNKDQPNLTHEFILHFFNLLIIKLVLN